MRSRQDTVRCVASALTDDGPTDLAEELARSETYVENLSNQNDDWENWMPDPIDASTSEQSNSRPKYLHIYTSDFEYNFQKIKSQPVDLLISFQWLWIFMVVRRFL